MADTAKVLAQRLRDVRIAVVGYEVARDELWNQGPAVTVTTEGARELARRCGFDDDALPADVALVYAFGQHDALAGLAVQSEWGNVRIGKINRDATAAILVILGCASG